MSLEGIVQKYGRANDIWYVPISHFIMTESVKRVDSPRQDNMFIAQSSKHFSLPQRLLSRMRRVF